MSESSLKDLESEISQIVAQLKRAILKQIIENKDGVIVGGVELGIRSGGIRNMKINCGFNKNIKIYREIKG